VHAIYFTPQSSLLFASSLLGVHRLYTEYSEAQIDIEGSEVAVFKDYRNNQMLCLIALRFLLISPEAVAADRGELLDVIAHVC
jgi:hypothetical protein